ARDPRPTVPHPLATVITGPVIGGGSIAVIGIAVVGIAIIGIAVAGIAGIAVAAVGIVVGRRQCAADQSADRETAEAPAPTPATAPSIRRTRHRQRRRADCGRRDESGQNLPHGITSIMLVCSVATKANPLSPRFPFINEWSLNIDVRMWPSF